MDRLKIYKNDKEYIAMPRVKYEVSGEPVHTEVEMVSGRIVHDITGYRKKITASYDYLPAETLTALLPIIQSCKYVRVEYLDSDNQVRTGRFKLEASGSKIFRFTEKGAMWRGVNLVLTAREVE